MWVLLFFAANIAILLAIILLPKPYAIPLAIVYGLGLFAIGWSGLLDLS